jgi:D-3-phosphoglycerate dehydrogenase
MKTVLIADVLPETCTEILENAGLEVVDRPGLSEEELKEAVKGKSGVICRSGAKLTAEVIEASDRLEAICRAGVGVNNIDIGAASRKGVVVMNTPGGNTTSTGEHAFALLLALARNIGPAYVSMRQERWDKKKFLGSQLAGSTLGVIGLGRIGQVVARRGVAFDMDVFAYDPYVSRDTAEKIGVHLVDELEELLEAADYITLHVPENDQTRGLIGREQIERMKDSACIVNCARGPIVDMQAVVDAVKNGQLGGAAFDVYEEEPPETFDFANHDRILATPHLGASTDAAQLAVARDAAEQMVDALQRQHFRNAVNTAAIPPEEMKALQPYCDLAVRLGRLVAQLNRGHPESVEIACKGEVAESDIDLVVNHGVMGVLQPLFGGDVNVVSAPHLAEERGIRITSSSTVGLEAGFTDLITVKLVTDRGANSVAGTVFGRKYPRIVRIDDFYVEVMPEGDLLVIRGSDVPGLIGKVGAILGLSGVNIARMGFGRTEQGGQAVLALNLDSPPDEQAIDKIRQLEVVNKALSVRL